MNAQKQVTITDLKAKFTKDFDTFGKMDPFLQFTVGKCFKKTQIASSTGKQPTWKDSIMLTYFDETHIVVKAYDEDGTQKEFIGSAKLEIKSLRFPGGSIDLNILTDNGQTIGTVTGKYTLKNLPQSSLLLLKNLRLELGTEQEAILKAKTFLQFSADDNSIETQPKDEIKGLSTTWSQNLRLKIKQSSKITISLIDKDKKQDFLFRYECFAKEFRLQAGTKRFNILNKKFERFAVLHIDYETVNLVSKQESVKNIERQKKNQSQLTAILIEKISTQLKIQGKDVYFKLIVGTNNYATQVFKKNQKQLSIQVKKTLNAEDKQNKLVIVLFSKDLIGQSILGHGHISLESLQNGDSKITLLNQSKQDVGTATLTLSYKTNPCKTLHLDNFCLNLLESGDIIGKSEPLVVAKIGNCHGSTQTGSANKVTFKKGIQLKYCEEQLLQIEIWDQDLTMKQLLYGQKVKLSDLKGNKGQQQITFKDQSKDAKNEPKATLTFKYEFKYNATEPPRKNTEKKIEAESPNKETVITSLQKQKQKTNSVLIAQSKKPGTQRNALAQQKPAKKEQVSLKQAQTQQRKSQTIIPINTNKTQPKQNEQRVRQSTLKPQQLKSSKRQNSSTKNNQHQQSFSNNKSRESFVLPSIIAGSKFFGDKIFDKQSAATLQKSILAYSMPKAMRFSKQPKYSGEPAYCMDTCFKANPTKGVGFGFGGKRQFPQWMERNMKENPPPGAYFDDKNNPNSKGPTFGLSHKYYQKVIIPKEQKSIVNTGRKLSPIRQQPK